MDAYINGTRAPTFDLPSGDTNHTSGLVGLDLLDDSRYIGVAVMGVLVFPAIAGNVLVIIAVHRYASLQTPTNSFVISLAAADLLLSVTAIPFSFLRWHYGGRYLIICQLCQVPLMVGVQSSFGSIALVSLDRYVAISRPLAYANIVTQRRVNAGIAFCWLFSVLNQFLIQHDFDGNFAERCRRLIYWNTKPEAFVLLVCVTVTSGVICVCNCLIGQVARQKLREEPALIPLGDRSQTAEANDIFKRELKIVKMIAMVISAYMLVWIPWVVAISVHAFVGAVNDIILVHGHLNIVVYAQSVVNPFIYAWRNRNFNQAFRRLLGLKTNEVHAVTS